MLVHYRVTDKCIGCTLCAQDCPVGAIDLVPFEQHFIKDDLCTRCDACRTGCPENAIVSEGIGERGSDRGSGIEGCAALCGVKETMTKITIDGLEIEVPSDATILDAARQAGIEIPTLCYLPGHIASPPAISAWCASMARRAWFLRAAPAFRRG